MTIKTLKELHESDWENIKQDYSSLKQDKDISNRMNLLIGFYEKFNPQKIMDVGCGSGYLGHLIKKLNATVKLSGFDVSDYAIERAKAYDNMYTLDIDKKSIPEENDSFDMVFCAEVIEHIYDVEHCLEEIKRILKPSGIVILTTPNFSFWRYRIRCLFGRIPKIVRDIRHIRVFNHNLLTSICCNIGFDVAYAHADSFLDRKLQVLFNKTIILVLRKK